MSAGEQVDRIVELLVIGGIALAAILFAFVVLLVINEERRVHRNERVAIQQQVLKAERQIHKLSLDAFDEMLVAARSAGGQPGSTPPTDSPQS